MLEEIGRRPGNAGSQKASAATVSSSGTTISADREGYALSAGLALGLICLGHGRDAVGLADMKIEERLRSAAAAKLGTAQGSRQPVAAPRLLPRSLCTESEKPPHPDVCSSKLWEGVSRLACKFVGSTGKGESSLHPGRLRVDNEPAAGTT